MRIRILAVLATAIFAQCSTSSESQFGLHTSSSSSQIKGSEIEVIEKRIKKVQMKSEDALSEVSSKFSHQGHNIFYNPQIVIGSDVKASYISGKIDDTKYNEQKTDTVLIDCMKNETEASLQQNTIITNIIPEAPVLPPLVMPELPIPVIIEEPVVILPPKVPVPVKEVIIQHDTVIMPEVPVIVPQPIAIPSCMMEKSYLVNVPCPPTIAVSPEIIEKITVKKPLLLSQPSPVLNLRLPKIPIGVVYNKRVETVMPYSQGFVSTTRFLPSVKVTKIPFERFSQQNILIRPSPEVVVKNIGSEIVGLSSFSAYCAHNIALQRVLPNIIVGK
ncbi:uncharacterized protein LOC128198250 [Bicyclus anynana]|uniref:Uncharacterized protein LOC128198250 n=1 Tax=Bicyclus anynana TaxID=110368 RepID=A0ABM3LHG1_BICAN|nr:uncharacterized protein LOC128198250 [Bicyclus anynana]